MRTTPNLADLIDLIVIIVKENHTFDKYFGPFPGAEGANLQLVAADTRINSAAVTCAVKSRLSTALLRRRVSELRPVSFDSD
jgi:phospholipase C